MSANPNDGITLPTPPPVEVIEIHYTPHTGQINIKAGNNHILVLGMLEKAKSVLIEMWAKQNEAQESGIVVPRGPLRPM